MTRLDGWKRMWAAFLLCTATAIAVPAQIFTTLADLNGSAGFPTGSLIQGRDGNFYGVSSAQSMFQVTAAGQVTILHAFTEYFGSTPTGVIQAADGNFYGTTFTGGANFFGMVFKITPSGELTTLHSFDDKDGAAPVGIIQGADRDFYGMAYSGGANGYGTVFKVTSQGVLTTLHDFDYTDGAGPSGGLIQARDGSFYGTTGLGGNLNCVAQEVLNGCGVVFKIDLHGQFTLLHKFNLDDGAAPSARMLQAGDGSLYGVTFLGGDAACGCGTVFKISPAKKLTTLYEFHGQGDGAYPLGALIQATDGALYGVTVQGGLSQCSPADSCGTVFRIGPNGKLTTLHSFCQQQGCPDGMWPHGGLLQGTNGLLYGTASEGGGSCSCGTVFSLDMSLNPFVTFVRGYGKIGARDGILGQGFKEATGVSFSGTPAKFSVRSDTFLVVAVPPGATSGYVTVTTSTGTLRSNRKFIVLR